MDLGDRGVDVAVREVREPDVTVGIMPAEAGHPRVVDAQHLVGRFDVLQLRGGRQDAVDDLGVDAVAVHLLDAQVRIPWPANALLAVLVETGRGHDVDPELLAGLVLGARGAHAARQTEDGAVVGDPARAIGPVGHVGHALLQLARRFRDEQVRRQPDEIEVTVRRDSVVAHGSPPVRLALQAVPAIVPRYRPTSGSPSCCLTSLMTSSTRVCSPGYSIPNSLARRLQSTRKLPDSSRPPSLANVI